MRGTPAVPALDWAWERALELAWEAFCAGTAPVGAVVVDASGSVVAQGRCRRHDTSPTAGQLAGTAIAHAELNALAQLPAGRHYPDHTLLTTLEPCVMCHGAALQAGVGGLMYAAADPYAGTGRLDFGTPQSRYSRLRVAGPVPDERGDLAALLHIAWSLRSPAGPQVAAALHAGLPDLTRLAERLSVRLLLAGAVARQASLAEVRSALRSDLR
ncbi:MAG TPA: nucleoside deaminase [Streptosporangiaceae bacterium]